MIRRPLRRRLLVTGVCAVTLTGALTAASTGAATATTTTTTSTAPATTIVVQPGHGQHPISRLLFGANNNYAANGSGMFDAKRGRVYPDFVRETQRSGFTAMRFPGGTMANTYHFTRAIGPQAKRTDNVNGVLSDPEPLADTFGPDEYGRFLDQTGMTGDLMLNFGTGTPAEAADFVEYMTARVGTNPNGGVAWADVRARNGHPAPYPIRYAEIGNELGSSGQLYWMSGASSTSCTAAVDCLYAHGGSTTFTAQPAVGYADWRASASKSTGQDGQVFYARYAPVAAGSQTVYVDGAAWQPVTDLASAPAGAHDYQLDDRSGAIRFGGGSHGAAPASGATITVTYTSGPHAGFDAYYAAVKRADPHIQVCSSVFSDEFLKLMGRTHPYDCVVQHEYEAGPATGLPLDEFHDQLMQSSATLGDAMADLQRTIRQTAGPQRARHITTVATEYGELGATEPAGAPHFHLSLDEGVFVADLIRHWAELGVPLAEKAKLTDYVFQPAPAATQSVGFPENAMLSGPAPGAVVTPTAQIMRLLSTSTGPTFVASRVRHNVVRSTGTGPLPALTTLASRDPHGRLFLTVINRDQSDAVRSTVDTGDFRHASRASVGTVDGPSLLSYNTPSDRHVTSLTRRTRHVGAGRFAYTFPAHSVTTITFDRAAH